MRGLLITFFGAFLFIWGLGVSINYLQNMYRRNIATKPSYGDFSPQDIENQRKKMVDDQHRQMEYYERQQSAAQSQQESQKRLMESQKRQMENMKRLNEMH